MATADEQTPPALPEAPLGLGVRRRSPPPTRSDARSPPLDEDLRDLRLEEGDAEKDGVESASEASEEDGEEGDEKKGKVSTGEPFYPRRPGEADCVFYVQRGKCAFGRKCRFNHPPLGKKSEQVQSEATSELGQATKVDVKEMGEEKKSEKVGKLRCKYFDTPGGCKYGSACRYNHIEEKMEAELVELNFLGLPLRPGEKECPFYMQKGSCKFSTSCKYNHPDPSVLGGSNAQTGHFGSGFSHLNVSGVPHIPVPFHVPQRTPTNSFPYMHGPPYGPPMPAVHQHPVHLNSGWNRYQHPMDLPFTPEASGRYMPIPPPTQAPPNNSNRTIHQQHNQITEFPQRPGQLDCPYYMKSGDCKFKSACKFNHPKDRHSPACLLSPKGLPLRPGQSVCAHYSRYGICKFGPTCIYDHPMDHVPSQTMAQ